MIIPVQGGAYVNVAHISLLSGVQRVQNRPNAAQIRMILMGGHEHISVGTQEEMSMLHERVKNAMEQLRSTS